VNAIVTGMLLAAVLAVGAAFVLNSEVQRSAADLYSTEAVRL
jgi:hypothetical protein